MGVAIVNAKETKTEIRLNRHFQKTLFFYFASNIFFSQNIHLHKQRVKGALSGQMKPLHEQKIQQNTVIGSDLRNIPKL